MVDHNSHIADKLETIERIEKKNLDEGRALYKSALFCSLVSLLRYVKINEISYRFTANIMFPNSDNKFNFREKEETIAFIDKIQSRIEGHDIYSILRK